MNGGEPFPALVVRPVQPDDEFRLGRAFDRLSPETIYRRFFSPTRRLSPAALHRFANVDHHDREALVALEGDEIIAVGRWERDTCLHDHAEVALVVEDAWQQRGIGAALARMLVNDAVGHHIAILTATIQTDNTPVRRLLASTLGPPARAHHDGIQIHLTYRIAA